MPDDKTKIDTPAGETYCAEYYASRCGGLIYGRQEPHWGRFFGGIADQIVRSLHPRRVFDAGCAHGFLVEALWDRGVETWGRDISHFAVSEVRADLRPFVAQGSIADLIEGEYDLVTCIDVLEHMEETEAVCAIATMAAAAPRLLFSSPPNDLTEPTHVNVKPVIWWLHRFAEAGLAPVADYDASFLVPHAYLLERSADGGSARNISAFAELVRQRMLAHERGTRLAKAEQDTAWAAAALAEAERARQQEAARAATALAEAEQARQHESATAVAAGAAAAERARLEAAAIQAALGHKAAIATLSELEAKLAAAYTGQSVARAERDALLNSTTWRATRSLRRAAGAMKVAMRHAARRAAGVGRRAPVPPVPKSSLSSAELPPPASLDLLPAPTTAEPPRDTNYDRWVRECDTLTDDDRAAIRAHIERFVHRPLISVVMPAYETPKRLLREAIASVRAQLYPYWELCVADDASPSDTVAQVLGEVAEADTRIIWMRRDRNGHIAAATNSALALASGEFVALMDHDDLLPEQALYEVAVKINAHLDADLLYSDEDQVDATGRRHSPYFKPAWNIDLLLGHNFVSHLGVYRRSLLERIGGLREGLVDGSHDYDLALRAAAATEPARICHIPAVLYHWRRVDGASSFSQAHLDHCVAGARQAIGDYLKGQGVQGAEVLAAPAVPQWTRTRWPLPDPAPAVSVIVPTRDKPDLLARCTDGLLHRTDYPQLELLIVDNDSRDPEAVALLGRLQHDRRVRILPFPGPFNYSAINNAAVREATGEIVVLANNDVDVIDGGWLREMVSLAVRPDVGAVGAKLLYANGSIQHAGVVLLGSQGVAGHFGYHADNHETGYCGQFALTRELSAVTGACLALRKQVYEAVGGLDAEHLVVQFNDVDLCLRIREAGLRVIWTPFAELYHLESASRGLNRTPEQIATAAREADYMRDRWGAVLDSDPFYNPNFDRLDPNCRPAVPPRREKPWLAMPTRSEILLAPVPRGGRIIEIGPSYSPIAPKAAGWDVHTVDHLTREGLVAKYTGHPGVDVNCIEEVDYVWSDGPLSDAVPSALHGTFDAIIASHLIEHSPDLVAFLDSAASLLKPEGVVVLVVPDKRYCFDYFQPLTTTGQVIEAHAERRSRHSQRVAFDHVAYAVENGGVGAWGQHPSRGLRLVHPIEQARELFASMRTPRDYVDLHAWRFSPASFELLLLELARLDETDWRVNRITEAAGCEFFAWLRRGGKATAAALSDEALAARRLALLKRTLLETRAQIDWLLTGEPELVTGPLGLLPTGAPAAPPPPQAAAPRFVDWFPARENAGRALKGEWSSAVHGLPTTGHAPRTEQQLAAAAGHPRHPRG
jgi:GT2 family glycosyltransferase/2-polyprenyl-3-methyl-5-hydroxy-6-metoxy-1,4-benzoquinol methylase